MPDTLNHATQRLLTAVWTLAYVYESDDKIRIVSYDRDNPIGYLMEKELPRIDVIENDERTVLEIVMSPNNGINSWADKDGKRYEVTNPQHIFDYKG